MLLASCASPQKSFNKGDYEKAYDQALKNIKKGKKSRSDRSILKESFQEIMRSQKDKIARNNNSNMIEDWEEAYLAYEELFRKYEEGKTYLYNDMGSEISILRSDQDQLKEDIAENYYQLAEESYLAYQEDNYKLDAQDAYVYYDKASDYDSHHSDIGRKMDQALEWGTVHILVMAEQRFGFSNNWDIDREFSQVERRSRGFEEVYYESNEIDADCVLEVVLDEPATSVRDSRSTESFSERIEDGYDTQVDTSGNTTRIPRYTTVTGTVTTIREEIIFFWEAQVLPSGDSKLCNRRRRVISAEERVNNEVYEWTGDRRAIPSRYLNNNNRNQFREEDVMDDLLEELYEEFVRYYF